MKKNKNCLRCKVIFIGTYDNLTGLVWHIDTKEREIDLNILDPIPDDIMKTTKFAGANLAFTSIYNYENTGDVEYLQRYIKKYDSVEDCVNTLKSKIGYSEDKAKLLINNKKRYGIYNWAEWNKYHWDMKYNAFDIYSKPIIEYNEFENNYNYTLPKKYHDNNMNIFVKLIHFSLIGSEDNMKMVLKNLIDKFNIDIVYDFCRVH